MFYRNKKKTREYVEYQHEIRDELMGTTWQFGDQPVEFDFTAGVSTRAADLDNVIKPLLDTYQNIYSEFNDNKVYKIKAHKEIVKKGDEFLRVTIRYYEPDGGGLIRPAVSSKNSKKQED